MIQQITDRTGPSQFVASGNDRVFSLYKVNGKMQYCDVFHNFPLWFSDHGYPIVIHRVNSGLHCRSSQT